MSWQTSNQMVDFGSNMYPNAVSPQPDQWLLKDKCLSMVNEPLIFIDAADWRGKNIDEDRDRCDVNRRSVELGEALHPAEAIAVVAS